MKSEKYKYIYPIQTNQATHYTIRKYNKETGKKINYGTFPTITQAIQYKQFLINENWKQEHQTSPYKNYQTRYIYYHKRKYTIQKRIKGKIKHYGSYNTLQEAQTVRNHLIKNNWKQEHQTTYNKLQEIKEKTQIKPNTTTIKQVKFKYT